MDNFSKTELKDVVNMVEILACGDKDKIVKQYKHFKKIKKQDNQEKREKMKKVNRYFYTYLFSFIKLFSNIIQKVKELNIWFPYPNEINEWKNDARLQDQVATFLELVDKVKTKMKQERKLLQYIPKRRLTNKTVEDLSRNIKTMQMYLTI
jgi:esterase/lipase